MRHFKMKFASTKFLRTLGPVALFSLVLGGPWTGELAAQKAAKKKTTTEPPTVFGTVRPAETRPEIAIPADHPLAPAIETARRGRAALRSVRDYTTTFSKRELLAGRVKSQSMEMKFREQPFSVYFNFRGGAEAGREALYVEGQNGNKLLVHEDGVKAIAGTIPFAPTHPTVMAENRYPITKVGISHMLETVIAQWEGETKYGEVDVKFYPDASLGNVSCIAYESTHPTPRREFRFHLTRLYFDKQTNYPIRVEQYDWPSGGAKEPPLVEEYTYSNLRVNVGLSDADFDRRNRSYRF